MRSPHKSALAVFAAVCFLAVAGMSQGKAPDWLRQAAAMPLPSYDKDVHAVVLHNEEVITVDSSGRLTTTERRAVRITQKDGKSDAVATAFYLSKFSNVKDFEAWLIAPGGAVTSFGKKETIDRISDPDDIYDEGRVKIINASSLADVGYVFGYTATVEDRPLFYQHQFHFQDTHPALRSRLTLNLPSGWKATSLTFNRDQVQPQISGTTYTWELTGLPAIKDEPMSPSFYNVVPRVAVNYGPEGTTASDKVFSSWKDVSVWATRLYEPKVVINEAIRAKTMELTANAKTELEKIRAIGTFVQNLQYISIDIGVGHGNGLIPRASDMVLGRGYGDCKDKANLMRAMLKVLGIDAFPVIIYSGDPTFVRAEWPSPRQFNHCIIAVKVSKETEGPTVIEHAGLGRLLIFDATDQFTPVGDLPDYLQGSNGLVLAGEQGGLFEMPVTPPDFNAWNRETEFSLSESGAISGKMVERITGQESRRPRTMLRSISNDDFRKSVEYWLTRGATAAKLVGLKPNDDHQNASFDMEIEFSAPLYGQLMQNRLLVFKPVVANRSRSVYLTEKSRENPISLESNLFREKVVIDLPAGFDVDEMPEPVKIATSFGSYETAYEVVDGKLHFSRSMMTKRTVVPVEKYETVRDFFTKIRDAEQSPVVLIRK